MVTVVTTTGINCACIVHILAMGWDEFMLRSQYENLGFICWWYKTLCILLKHLEGIFVGIKLTGIHVTCVTLSLSVLIFAVHICQTHPLYVLTDDLILHTVFRLDRSASCHCPICVLCLPPLAPSTLSCSWASSEPSSHDTISSMMMIFLSSADHRTMSGRSVILITSGKTSLPMRSTLICHTRPSNTLLLSKDVRAVSPALTNLIPVSWGWVWFLPFPLWCVG